MGMVINQYDVYLVNLDPTVGHEIKKTRPCLVISPDEKKNNKNTHEISVKFEGKNGWIVLDQIRTVDNIRLVKRLGQISKKEILAVKKILKEMLVD